MFISGQAGTILQEESRKGVHSGRDDVCSQTETNMYGTEAKNGSYVWEADAPAGDLEANSLVFKWSMENERWDIVEGLEMWEHRPPKKYSRVLPSFSRQIHYQYFQTTPSPLPFRFIIHSHSTLYNTCC
jgi:hypothetical protein